MLRCCAFCACHVHVIVLVDDVVCLMLVLSALVVLLAVFVSSLHQVSTSVCLAFLFGPHVFSARR